MPSVGTFFVTNILPKSHQPKSRLYLCAASKS